jgi:hypothetical protein
VLQRGAAMLPSLVRTASLHQRSTLELDADDGAVQPSARGFRIPMQKETSMSSAYSTSSLLLP